ncbi:MAG: hypothetical protein WCY90_00125 [Bacilli bacterium]
MGGNGSLKHLSQEDKTDILMEIEFFFSPNGFIDGLGLYERFESLLHIQGNLSLDYRKYLRERRKRK